MYLISIPKEVLDDNYFLVAIVIMQLEWLISNEIISKTKSIGYLHFDFKATFILMEPVERLTSEDDSTNNNKAELKVQGRYLSGYYPVEEFQRQNQLHNVINATMYGVCVI